MAIAAAVRGIIRYEGWAHLPRTALNAFKPLEFHIFLMRRGDPIVRFPIPEGVTLHSDALERVRALRRRRTDLPNEFWRDRINGASLCALAEVDSEPASILWAYAAPAKRPLVILDRGDAEFSGVYTLEKFRGRGLHRALLSFAAAWQLGERSRLFMVAAGDNPTSIRAIGDVGFREVAVIRRMSLFGPKFSAAQMRIKPPFEPAETPGA
jgi:GNAT superfamily N-acetyltransferase